jgi:HK97 family phage major capsid protein
MAQAKTARRARGRADALETKALETKEGESAHSGAPTGVEMKSLQEQVSKMLEQVNQTVQELNKQKTEKKSGEPDPLTDRKADKEIAALEAKLVELKTAFDKLELKANRPAVEGREGVDDGKREGKEVETKADGAFDAEYKSAFAAYARTGSLDGFKGLVEDFELKDMSTLSDPDGGFFVREEMDREISRIITERGGFRSLARVQETGAKEWKKRVNLGGASAGWVGEKDTRGKTSTPRFEEVRIQTGELYARPEVTQQALEDLYMDVEDLLAEEIAIEFDVLESEAFMNGDGADGRPRGLLTHSFAADSASLAWGKFGFVGTGVNGALPSTAVGDQYKKLVDFQHALKRAYRGQASWIMTDTTKAALRKVLDADGRPLLVNSPMNGGITTLLERPIHEVDEMDEMSSNGYAIGFGDWSRTYMILDRLGTSVDRFYDASTAPYVQFYTRKRVGGGVIMFESAKFLKFAA